jgi:hypothetical protein
MVGFYARFTPGYEDIVADLYALKKGLGLFGVNVKQDLNLLKERCAKRQFPDSGL